MCVCVLFFNTVIWLMVIHIITSNPTKNRIYSMNSERIVKTAQATTVKPCLRTCFHFWGETNYQMSIINCKGSLAACDNPSMFGIFVFQMNK